MQKPAEIVNMTLKVLHFKHITRN